MNVVLQHEQNCGKQLHAQLFTAISIFDRFMDKPTTKPMYDIYRKNSNHYQTIAGASIFIACTYFSFTMA